MLFYIKGMDPAGPYFEDTDLMVRLDPTDAMFVDAIHTDTDPIYTIGKNTKKKIKEKKLTIGESHLFKEFC